MARKRIYLACPISPSGGCGDLVGNVQIATEAFFRLLKAGFAPFNPAWSAFAGWSPENKDPQTLPRDTTHDMWLEVDLPWVLAADAVLRVPGESRGADREIQEALMNGVPVFFREQDLIDYFQKPTE